MKIIEEELGRPWTEVFSEMSPEPIAAASLAQVYKGKLVSTGEYVAIKVQRPQMLETVSKDLYVMRRAVEVYQKYIVTRFTAQTTDYQELLQVFATGFYQGMCFLLCVCVDVWVCVNSSYSLFLVLLHIHSHVQNTHTHTHIQQTELDFLNEAQSQIQMKQLLKGSSPGVYVPKVFSDLSTRRLLVSEWIDGIKLTQASQEDIRRLTKVAQECFLRQLLEWGVFHADPHPGV
jgi:predicted unusual protein kinase regulating ubiquinone biosynthesis (AarF/ABC1/UbiB family)